MNNTAYAPTATREIDIATLDQVVGGAGIVLHDARKQEQGDKLNSENEGKSA